MAFERLILASASPRRVALLQQLGLTFEVAPAKGDEPDPELGEAPEDYVVRAAVHKAHRVQQQLRAKNAWVLGADTIVIIDGEILLKPTDEDNAKAMLTRLSNKQHQVVTGFAILHQTNGIEYTESVTTDVWFRKLTPFQITRYVKTGEPMDKAGSYGIQEMGAALVDKIEGCYFNVVGLPIGHVIAALEKHKAGTLF